MQLSPRKFGDQRVRLEWNLSMIKIVCVLVHITYLHGTVLVMNCFLYQSKSFMRVN